MTTTETATKTVRKRDSAGTRARILNVATREFANKGYEGAKTDDIADSIIAVVTDLLGAGAATREALRSAQMHATSSFQGIPTDNPIAQAFSAAGNRGRIPRGTMKMTQQRGRRYR